MIIFSLECLADDSHRRHFIDRKKTWVHEGDHFGEKFQGQYGYQWLDSNGKITDPDYRAYYDACHLDEPIKPCVDIIEAYRGNITIWTERSENYRYLTERWLNKNDISYEKLKMRPIGNTEPAHVLKEKWYDLHNVENPRQNIDFVFDSDEQSIQMWRRRGIFCFDCRQK